MKILGLDLDNSPHTAKNKAVRYAQNITVDSKGESYFNERGFENLGDLDNILKNKPTNDYIIPNIYSNSSYHKYDIIGTIPTNIGVVLFCIVEHWNNEDKSDIKYNDAIIYIDTENNNPTIKRCLYSTTHAFNFNINRPIHGDYIYNYKENLIIAFTEGTTDEANETRIINISDPFYDGNNGESTNLGIDISIEDVDSFNLIPNVIYPELSCTVNTGGNLKTGAYQIAIAYKLNDGTYTNYSPLSTSLIICGDYDEDYELGIEINKNITISFKSDNIKYKYCKFAIVYIDDESQLSYETEDIAIGNSNTTHIISDISNLASISLDDIFIKNISYIKDNTLVNFNNRLIRGNVKTLNYNNLDEELKDFTKNNLSIELSWEPTSTYINTTNRYFKSGEVYVLYAGYYDYKGDLVNIHNIPWKVGDATEAFAINGENNGHLIPYNVKSFYDKFIPTWTIVDAESEKNLFEWYLFNTSTETTKEGYHYGYINIIPNTFSNNDISTENYKFPKGFLKDPNVSLPNSFDEQNGLLPENYSLTGIVIENKSDEGLYIPIGFKLGFNNAGGSNIENLSAYLYDITSIYERAINEEPSDTYYEINTNPISSKTSNAAASIFGVSLELQGAIYIAPHSKKCLLANMIVSGAVSKNIESGIISGSSIDNYTLSITNSEIVGSYSMSPIINIVYNKDSSKKLMNKYINSIVYFFVEHNINNSRIITQGFAMRDTETNNFAKSQTYKNPFGGNNARFYTFEYLFNKINSIKGKLKPLYFETDVLKFNSNTEIDDDIKVFKVKNPSSITNPELTDEVIKEGTSYLDADINNLSISLSRAETDVSLEYINPNNTSQNNIAGDSYYRIENGFKGFNKSNDNWKRGFIGDLINSSKTLYSDIANQKLQIASAIINIKNKTTTITPLVGDTFIGYITLRATAPSEGYRYGDNDHKELDSNSTVYRWIFTIPLESKFNILARFSINNVDKSFKYHGKTGDQLKEFYQISYQVDNFINSDTGKGYSTIYNENGIETFIYYEEIPGTQDHPYRIIRSQLQNAENANLNWRLFRSDDYKDMPFNRGEIISLKTDNKNLYIQQAYGLHLLQLRDTLSNTDEGTSYLGTSDIFNMEPQEVTYSPTGYIGCQSYFDTHINVIGYFVIDAVHKRIFNISGDKVTNISALNTLKWFDEHLVKDANNPFVNNGRVWAFNEDTNILYLIQNCKSNTFTISYSPVNNCWLSFHTYNPIVGITNRNGLFWFDNNNIYAISKNNYGRYLKTDTIEKSIIQFILNDNVQYNKLLNVINWKDRVDVVNILLPKENKFALTISKIMVHNDDQCSNYQIVKFNNKWYDGNTGVNKINIWKFNNINDIAKSIPFLNDAININEDALFKKPKWYNINKFICQFVYCTMIFDNTNDKELWELIDVNPEWILDNRNNQR